MNNAKPKTAQVEPDIMERYYHRKEDCFAIAFNHDVPRFGIKPGDIFYAYERSPVKGDIIACSVPGSTQSMVVAKFIKAKNERALIEAADGMTWIITPRTTVVIEYICRRVRGKLKAIRVDELQKKRR